MDTTTVLLLVALVVGIAIYFWIKFNKNRHSNTQLEKTYNQKEMEFDAELRHEYSAALVSGDKTKALELGKKYYQNLLGERYNDDIEKTISDDLSRIKKA